MRESQSEGTGERSRSIEIVEPTEEERRRMFIDLEGKEGANETIARLANELVVANTEILRMRGECKVLEKAIAWWQGRALGICDEFRMTADVAKQRLWVTIYGEDPKVNQPKDPDQDAS